MPPPSNGVIELEKELERINKTLEFANQRINEIASEQSEISELLEAVRRECEREIAVLKQRIEQQRIDDITAKQSKTTETVETLRRESEREIALLKQRIDDMRQSWDKWLMRLWALLGPIVGVLLAYFLGIKK